MGYHHPRARSNDRHELGGWSTVHTATTTADTEEAETDESEQDDAAEDAAYDGCGAIP